MVSEIVGIHNRNSTDRRQTALPVEFDRRSGIDRREVAQKNEGETSVFRALEVLPPVRRVSSLPDKLSNGDIVPALGVAGLAFINLPEDWNDIKSAYGQVRSKIDKTYHYDPLYDRKNYQHDFSFLRGTAIEKWIHQKRDEGSKLAQKIYELDRYTLAETKFGEASQKLFGVKMLDAQNIDKIRDAAGVEAQAFKFKSKIWGGEITTRAMKRMPLLSVIALGLIELPRLIKAFYKGDGILEHTKNGAKQTIKSSINVASTATGIAYGGAIGAKYGGAFGSLVGMGLGAILGSEASNKLQKVIP